MKIKSQPKRFQEVLHVGNNPQQGPSFSAHSPEQKFKKSEMQLAQEMPRSKSPHAFLSSDSHHRDEARQGYSNTSRNDERPSRSKLDPSFSPSPSQASSNDERSSVSKLDSSFSPNPSGSGSVGEEIRIEFYEKCNILLSDTNKFPKSIGKRYLKQIKSFLCLLDGANKDMSHIMPDELKINQISSLNRDQQLMLSKNIQEFINTNVKEEERSTESRIFVILAKTFDLPYLCRVTLHDNTNCGFRETARIMLKKCKFLQARRTKYLTIISHFLGRLERVRKNISDMMPDKLPVDQILKLNEKQQCMLLKNIDEFIKTNVETKEKRLAVGKVCPALAVIFDLPYLRRRAPTLKYWGSAS